MSTATATGPTALGVLQDLADRFDPGDIDVPGGEAKIRLEVTDGEDFDALISLPEISLEPASGRPDAKLSADSATWAEIAADVRGGMAAFSQGRLSIRHDLHLGIGFLAATGGETDPGRLRFHRVETADHEIAVTEAGEGAAADLHPRARRDEGLLHDDGERARAAGPPRHRDRPARLRRLVEAVHRRLRRHLVLRGGRRR